MADHDWIVVGSGFAGSSATLSFLETTESEGASGRIALLEVGKEGERAGASRWTPTAYPSPACTLRAR
jgi:glycine/D-amino acid oxidase-like deaminating enzyme